MLMITSFSYSLIPDPLSFIVFLGCHILGVFGFRPVVEGDVESEGVQAAGVVPKRPSLVGGPIGESGRHV